MESSVPQVEEGEQRRKISIDDRRRRKRKTGYASGEKWSRLERKTRTAVSDESITHSDLIICSITCNLDLKVEKGNNSAV